MLRREMLYHLLVPLLVPLITVVTMAGESPAGRDAEAPWAEQVAGGLAASEYEVTWSARSPLSPRGGAWQAPNRAQGFRTTFLDEGPVLAPRGSDAGAWHWGLALQGYGRGGRAVDVAPARVYAHGARVEYRRGAITEWYHNGPRGLEQGLTLDVPPKALASGSESWSDSCTPARRGDTPAATLIHLDLLVTGSTRARLAADGQALDFFAGQAGVIHLSELRVVDAGGRELPAWFAACAVGGNTLQIVIDDSRASYPLTIDPLASSPFWARYGGSTNAYLGEQVSTAGDINGDGFDDLLITENTSPGMSQVEVFLGMPSGLATVPATVISNPQPGDNFGSALATAGDVNGDGYDDVLIGSPKWDNGEVDEGRAYLYLGSSTGLSTTPAWTRECDLFNCWYGLNVDPAGDVNGDGYADIVVSSMHFNDPGSGHRGVVDVFYGSPGGLSTTPDWRRFGTSSEGLWGVDASTAGDANGDGYDDLLLAASGTTNSSGDGQAGRVYLFLGSASGLASTAAWSHEGAGFQANFGERVSTAGDVDGDGYADALIGAYRYSGSDTREGRALVFRGNASGLDNTPQWIFEGNQLEAQLGKPVATAGDVNGDGYADIAVGSPGMDSGETDEGKIYVFYGGPAGLPATPDWTDESNQAGAGLGGGLSTAGDVNGDGYSDLIAGARWYDLNFVDEGAVFVYAGGPGTPSQTPDWHRDGGQAGAALGVSVSGAGDVNGDGYGDVVVGADHYDGGLPDEGRAMVFLGSSTGLATTAHWSALGGQANAHFGSSVAGARDVNGDGYDDVVVGADGLYDGPPEQGGALLYQGSPTGLSSGASWKYLCGQGFAHCGGSVDAAGDVNGDGYADVVIGAGDWDTTNNDSGRVMVFNGSATGLPASPSWIGEGHMLGEHFGESVAGAGDVDGDGFADLLVGSWGYSNGQSEEGRAQLFAGGPGGVASSPLWQHESNQPFAHYGQSVASAGDVDGDGRADILVGAPDFDNGETDEGRVFLYLGSSSGPSGGADWVHESDKSSAAFGSSVSSAGDVNGDGRADVLVGAEWETTQPFSGAQGRAYLFLGSSLGLGSTPDWTATVTEPSSNFGSSVSGAGDVNGDAYADVLIGARSYSPVVADEGSVMLFYGNARDGISHTPQQRRADDSAPIGIEGLSHSPDGFRLRTLARTPFGRTKVKGEWEVKRLDLPFDGTGTQMTAAWRDTGTTGWLLKQAFSGLDPDAYHWRFRLRYHQASTPYSRASRWMSVPWGGWNQTDLRTAAFVGGKEWNDENGDGIIQEGEPPLEGMTVELYDARGQRIDTTTTDAAGIYHFEIDPRRTHRVHFLLRGGFEFTAPDQGRDDSIDSDADPVTGETPDITPPITAFDTSGWSAGQRVICAGPGLRVTITQVTKDPSGNPVLTIDDPNQPKDVTGYDIYRESAASAPRAGWPLIGSNVTDQDAATPGVQWTDASGDAAPTGIWFYDAAAFDLDCDAEGPR